MPQQAALPGVPAPARGTAGVIHISSATEFAAEVELRVRRGIDLIRCRSERPLSGRADITESRNLSWAKLEAEKELTNLDGYYRMSPSELGALIASASGRHDGGDIRSWMERRVKEVISPVT